MKKVIALLSLLTLLIAELAFVGFVEAKYASSHDVTTELVVTFEANKYQLTLDANGGAFADASDGTKTVDYKGTYGDLPVPTREGYGFDGWYTEKDSGTKIEATTKVEITQDTTIYAHWKANTYTIKYDANTGTGTMADTPATYDADVTLSPTTFEKIGYTFAGWSTTADGDIAYADKATVKNLTAEDKGTVTLYAQWEANQYVVIFDPNEGSGTMENQTLTYDAAENLNPNAFIRTGYTFDGWNTKADGTGISYEDEQQVENLVAGGNTMLYAQWRANTYTIEYNSNGGTGTMDATAATYDKEVSLAANTFTKSGYIFTGWNTEEEGGGTSYVDKDSVKNLATSGTATLYAQWKANTYTVKYNANGGTGTVESQIFTYGEKNFLRENDIKDDNGVVAKAGFRKDGYNFAGWGLSASGGVDYTEKQFVSNLTTNTEITLFAIWSAKADIVVTFDTCYAGAILDHPTKFVTYESTYGNLPVPTIEGYKFVGWFTAAEGGTQITADTKVTNKDNHTLYAQWEVPNIDLLLMFDGSGTSNCTTFAKHEYTYGTAVTYTGQTWHGKWESFSIGMHNLTVGGTYRLTFDASFSDRTCIRDKGNSYPIGCKVADHQQYAESGSTETYDWVPTDTNKSVKGYTIEFVANKSSMYWLWELSKIRNPMEEYGKWKPGVENFEESYFDLILDNVSLVLLDADIKFEETTALTVSGKGAFSLKSSTDDTAKFTYKGAGGLYEKGSIPITNLIPGETYTVDFDLETNAHGGGNYHFGFLIGSDGTLENADDFNSATRLWDGDSFITGSGTRSESGQFSFKATAATMYWIWDMQCVANDQNYTYNINASITLDPSATATTLSLRQEETHDIELIWDGIDDTNMDNWYPVDEQYPVSGNSYEMAFEPSNGYAMAETITVTIDGVVYAVRTAGQAGAGAPSYNPEQNILTIPAQLLTAQTRTVAIVASAVEIQTEETTESTEVTEQKTLLVKLLETQSLQALSNLLAGDEAYGLNASELSVVRQHADTIYAEAVLTEEVRSGYDLVSDRLNELVSRLVNQTEESNTTPTVTTEPDDTTQSTESTEPTVPTESVQTTQPTEPVVQSTTLKDKMLETQSLQELYNLLVSDEAGSLTAAELSQMRQHADFIYAEAALTEEVTSQYGLVFDRLNELVSQL